MARSQSSKRGASISTSTATTTAFTTTTATTTTTTAATPTTLLQHNASKSQQLTQQLPDSSWRMIQTYPAWLILVHKFTYKCQRCNTLQLASCNKKGQPFMARTRIFGVPSSFSTIFCGFKSWVTDGWVKKNIFFFQIPRRLGQEINCWDKKTPEGTREN